MICGTLLFICSNILLNKLLNNNGANSYSVKFEHIYANYIGQINESGEAHGIGYIVYDKEPHEKAAAYYAGDFANNTMQGYGRYVHCDGTYYEGEFSNNQYNGWGIYVYNTTESFGENCEFEGEFANSLPVNAGHLRFKSLDKPVAATYDKNLGFSSDDGLLSEKHKQIMKRLRIY